MRVQEENMDTAKSDQTNMKFSEKAGKAEVRPGTLEEAKQAMTENGPAIEKVFG